MKTQSKKSDGNKKLFAEVAFENRLTVIFLELSLLLLILSLLYFFNELTVFVLQTAAFLLSSHKIFARTAKDIGARKIFTENVFFCIVEIASVLINKTAEAVVVAAIFEFSVIIREFLERKTHKAIDELIDIEGKTVTKIESDEHTNCNIESISIGDVLFIAPGEIIYVDGIILNGESEIDLSDLTGDSTPVICREGDRIYSGTKNLGENITIEVISTFSDCVLTRIINAVEKGETKKSIRERVVDSFTKGFPPAVFALSLLFALIIPLFGSHEYSKWMYRALICLIIAYPYALMVTTPIPYLAGRISSSKKGIIFKSNEAIDISADLTSVAFDKTGAISTGRFEVVGIEPIEGIETQDLIKFAVHVEQGSEHPIAKAIRALSETEIDESIINNRIDAAGKGRIAVLQNGLSICVGNAEMMEELGLEVIPASSAVTSAYIAAAGKYIGRIDLIDAPKSDAPQAVERLRREGVVNVALITGDNTLAATRTGKEIGITEIYADCSLEDKIERIKYLTKLQSSSERLAYVCNSANDAEIFDVADIGVMIQTPERLDVFDNSNVIVLDDSPLKIPEFISYAKTVARVVDTNLIVSIGIKTLLIILGLSGAMSMWIAVLLDCLATFFAIINSGKPLNLKENIKTAD